MSTLQRAMEIAVVAHKGQTQKNNLPYVMHPLTLMLCINTDETRIAAVLHDVVGVPTGDLQRSRPKDFHRWL